MTESIGTYLKRIREERGLSVDQVTLKTRINKGYIRALEENRLEDFPGEVFARGFVKIYGRCLGLDDDETMERFEQSTRDFFRERDESRRSTEQSAVQEKSRRAFQGHAIQFAVIAALAIAVVTVFTLNNRNLRRAQESANTAPPPIAAPQPEGETEAPEENTPDLTAPAVNMPGVVNPQTKPAPSPVQRSASAPQSSPAPPQVASSGSQAPRAPEVAPAVPKASTATKPPEGLTGPPKEETSLNINVPGKPESAPAPEKPSASATPTAPAPPSSTPSTMPSASATAPAPAVAMHPPAPSGKNLVLVIEAVEPAWVSATIDGGQVKEVYLRPGDKVTWNASDHFLVNLGNAGGVKMEFDGEPVPTLGASGQVVKNIRFPRE